MKESPKIYRFNEIMPAREFVSLEDYRELEMKYLEALSIPIRRQEEAVSQLPPPPSQREKCPDTFRFTFTHDGDDDIRTVRVFSFKAEPMTEFAIAMLDEIFEGDGDLFDQYETYLSDMEDYGVHDCYWDEDTEISGFTSYEIKPEKYEEVMEVWRDWFEMQGFKTSPVIMESIDREPLNVHWD